ncbi:MAG: hypothetical protein MI864_13040 [Pseudomonadales bacterium]|nr:hypothetical protein [Pseudomonadales bacterium]
MSKTIDKWREHTSLDFHDITIMAFMLFPFQRYNLLSSINPEATSGSSYLNTTDC